MSKNKFAKQFAGAVMYTVDTLADNSKVDFNKIISAQNFENFLAKPCLPSQLWTIGLEPVIAGTQEEVIDVESGGISYENVVDPVYIQDFNGVQLLKLSISSKKIPKKEVDKIVKAKVSAFYAKAKETNEEVTISLKDLKADFKQVAEMELAPKLFSEENSYYIWLDTNDSKLYVSVPTYKKAEDIVDAVRSMLGSLPVYPVTVNSTDVAKEFTKLVETGFDKELGLADSFVLKEEKESVTFKGASLYNPEALELLKTTGYPVVKLGFCNDGVVNFVSNVDLELSGIKYDSVVTMEAIDELTTFQLCYAEIKKSFKNLTEALGGIVVYTDDDIDSETNSDEVVTGDIA